MCCARNYTDSVIAELQQVVATVEAERRRLHRAELAEELRQWLKSQFRLSSEDDCAYDSGYDDGWVALVWTVFDKLDELSPPVHCDNPPVVKLVSDEVAFYEATKSE